MPHGHRRRCIGARRLEPDSDEPNRRRGITVAPNFKGDVTIALPITTNCDDQGAICTAARMLFNRLEFTVTGPGGQAGLG